MLQLVRSLVHASAPLLLVGALVVPWSGAAGQTPTGTLLGQVVDDEGAPVAGAVVEASARDSGFYRQRTTNEQGRFLFIALPVGTYRLRVRQTGFRTEEREDVRVRAGEPSRVDLVLTTAPLELEGLSAEVTPVSISQTETEYSTRLGETTIELLPVGYDADELINQTAGARPGHVWGGATAQANNYQLDGLAANHPGVGGSLIEPSISWIESIEVRGLGAGAEHGNFQGGLIDVRTKSGSNRLRGALRVNGQSHAMSASNLGEHEIGSEIHGRYDVEGELRGPIVQDRLFYFMAGQWLQTDRRHLNHLRRYETRFLPVLEEGTEAKFFGKLTWQPTRRDRIELTGGRIHVTTDHYGQTGYEAPSASWRLNSPTTFYGANWQHSREQFVLEARLAAFARDATREPYAGEEVPGIETYGLRPPHEKHQNAPLRFRHAPSSLSTSVGGRFGFHTGGIEHRLRIGGEYSRGSFIDERLRNGGMTWRPPRLPSLDPQDPSSWVFSTLRFIPSTWGGEVRLHADVENSAIYLQNHMTLASGVALSPGIRYGRWRGWMTPDGGQGARFLAVEDQGLEPRFGIVLDLLGDNTLVTKAHWGRYHQNMLAQMFDRVGGSDVFTNEELWYYRGELFQDPRTRFTAEERDRLAEQGLFTLEEEIVLNETGPVEDYRQPYVDQWVVGLEKTIFDRVKFEAVYVNRRNHQMVSLVDRNRESNYTVYEHVRVLDAGGQALLYNGMPLMLNELYLPNHVLRERLSLIAAGKCDGCPMPPGLTLDDTLNLTYEPDYVLTNIPEARREFDQLQLSLEGAFDTWGISGSVVFTRLKGDLDTVTGYDDPAGFGPGPYVRVNEGVNAYGSLGNYADRELKFSVYGQLPWRLRGGLFWQYALGDRYSPQFTLSGLQYQYRTYDGRTIDEKLVLPLAGHNVFVGPRGSRQYPIRATVDARLEREFPVGDARWVITFEGYNLLNDDSVVEHNTSVNRGKNYYSFLPPHLGGTQGMDPNEYFQAVQARTPPRILRVGAAFRF